MRGDGWLTGYGMATALYDVPPLEHTHAALPTCPLGPVTSSGQRRRSGPKTTSVGH